MIKNFEDMQKLGQTNVDSAMKFFGEWNKNWQAIAAEMSDYTKRSFEESTSTLEKLMSSKSVEQAVEIQTGYAKRAYDDYMQQMSKIGGLYTSMAKEAYKPVEKLLLLDRLVGLFGHRSVHATDLRHLLHVVVVGALGKARLDLDGLLNRLRRHQLLK